MQSRNVDLIHSVLNYSPMPEPNLRDCNNRTAYHVACIRGNSHGVEELLKRYEGRLDYEPKNIGGETPLFFAVASGSVSTLKYCLGKGSSNPFVFNIIG